MMQRARNTSKASHCHASSCFVPRTSGPLVLACCLFKRRRVDVLSPPCLFLQCSLWVTDMPHGLTEVSHEPGSTNINKLAAEIEAAKKAAETRELMEGAKKKKKAGEIEMEGGGGEVVEEGKRIQTKSALAMDRTAKMVNEMEEMGAETNLHLKSQSEQIKTTHSDVDAINEGMMRASKQVRDIGRRLATGANLTKFEQQVLPVHDEVAGRV